MKALMILLVLLLAVPALGQTVEPFVALAQWGWAEWLSIDQSGNLFRYVSVNEEWIAQGNIPEIAGTTESSNFVGLSFWNEGMHGPCTPHTPTALTSTGEFYQQEGSGIWNHHGNIGELAGHPAAGVFVSLSFSAFPGAVTDLGEVYVRVGSGEWSFAGSIPADTGVVSTETETLGGAKGLYR